MDDPSDGQPNRATAHRTIRHPMRTRRTLLASLAGVSTSALAGCEDIDFDDIDEEDFDDPDEEDEPTVVHDPERVNWWAYRNMSEESFVERNGRAHDRGMYMVEIGFDETAERYYGIWHENTVGGADATPRDWVVEHDLDSDAFGDAWDDHRTDGYRLIDQEHYVKDGDRNYAGIWIENLEGVNWASHRNSTDSQFEDRYDDYADDYLPIDVSAYETDGGMRYAAVWVENTEDIDWVLERDVPSDEYGDVHSDLRSSDYRVIDLVAYENDGEHQVAAIWIENGARDPSLGAQDGGSGGRHWRAYRTMSPDRYGKRFRRMYDRGYRPVSLSITDIDGDTRIAAAWRQNAMRTTWGARGTVDDILTDFIDEQDLPSISAAIIEDGTFVYRRGFTNTDIGDQDDLDVDARSIYRLASISKSIAGILLFRLLERDDLDLDLDEKTRTYLETDQGSTFWDLPEYHTHTLRDLVSNRACIRSYGDYQSIPSTLEYDYYDTQIDALARQYQEDSQPEGDEGNLPLYHIPLVQNCTVGTTYEYSSHGFTFLGAALETEAGTSIDDLLEAELAEPFGLDSIRMEDRRDPDPHRVDIYSTSNEKLEEWDDGEPPSDDEASAYVDTNSWSVLGAGIEGNVYDLARLGQLLLDGHVLDAEALDELWDPPTIVGYAHGWRVGTHEVGEDDEDVEQYDYYEHGGRQQGGNGIFRIYEDEGIVIAILSNRRSTGSQPRPDQVARIIDDVAEAVL